MFEVAISSVEVVLRSPGDHGKQVISLPDKRS